MFQLTQPSNYPQSMWPHRRYAFHAELENEDELDVMRLSRSQLLAITWVKRMRDVITKVRKSLIITVEGGHRSGKSLFFFCLADLFDYTFFNNREDRVITDPGKLLELIKILQAKNTPNPVIIIDEAGATMNNQDFQQAIQKAIIKVLTVIGYLHPTIIFISTSKDFISAGLRKMANVHVRMKRNSAQYAWLYAYEFEHNSMFNKGWYKRPKIKVLGVPTRISRIKVFKPPQRIMDAYAEIEKKRKPQVVDDAMDILRPKTRQGRKLERQKQIETIMKEVQAAPERFARKLKSGKVVLNKYKIAATFKVAPGMADMVKHLVEDKINMEVVKHEENDDTEGGVGADPIQSGETGVADKNASAGPGSNLDDGNRV